MSAEKLETQSNDHPQHHKSSTDSKELLQQNQTQCDSKNQNPQSVVASLPQGSLTEGSETNRRHPSRYNGKRKQDVNSGEERAQGSSNVQSRTQTTGRNQGGIQLTQAERELFTLGNESLLKLAGNESVQSSQGTPTNSNAVARRKIKGEDSLNEGQGGRQRRPKAHFDDNFVYDEIVMRGAQPQKVAKDSSNPAVPSQIVTTSTNVRTKKSGAANGKQNKIQNKQGSFAAQGANQNVIGVGDNIQISSIILPQQQNINGNTQTTQQQQQNAQSFSQQMLISSSNIPTVVGGQLIDNYQQQTQEPIKLYCLCRTADESLPMISCDKCEEWYHFDCVGLDATQIPDLENFEFVCTQCKNKQTKSSLNSTGTHNKKHLQNQGNKRTQKAQEKKQSTKIYDFINQPLPSSSQQQNKIGLSSQQLQSASVQQKRKFQKNRAAIQQQSPTAMTPSGQTNATTQKTLSNKKALGKKAHHHHQHQQDLMNSQHGRNPVSAKILLDTQLSGMKRNLRQEDERIGINMGSHFESEEYDDDNYPIEENEEEFGQEQNELMMMNDYQVGLDGTGGNKRERYESFNGGNGQQRYYHENKRNAIIPQRIFDQNEYYQKSQAMNESNLEKIVEKGNYMYFVSKDGKDKPLDSHIKLQVPDRKFTIKDENIPNLKNILLKQLAKKEGELINGNSDNSMNEANNCEKEQVYEQILNILKDKLRANLKKIPSIYSFTSNSLNNSLLVGQQQQQSQVMSSEQSKVIYNQE